MLLISIKLCAKFHSNWSTFNRSFYRKPSSKNCIIFIIIRLKGNIGNIFYNFLQLLHIWATELYYPSSSIRNTLLQPRGWKSRNILSWITPNNHYVIIAIVQKYISHSVSSPHLSICSSSVVSSNQSSALSIGESLALLPRYNLFYSSCNNPVFGFFSTSSRRTYRVKVYFSKAVFLYTSVQGIGIGI